MKDSEVLKRKGREGGEVRMAPSLLEKGEWRKEGVPYDIVKVLLKFF